NQFASNNTIGGTTTAARNIISGHASQGIAIVNTGTTGNLVQGNFIGTNVNGTAAVSNGSGVGITNAPGNTIGGAVAGARNVISGNIGDGVGIGIFQPIT